MGKRGWAMLIMGVMVVGLLVLATPYIVTLIQLLTCKGPDCFP